jgi:hypothetical protein
MIINLPEELLVIIFSFLPSIILNEIKTVCKIFNRIIIYRDLEYRLIKKEKPITIPNNISYISRYHYDINTDILIIIQSKTCKIFKNLKFIKQINTLYNRVFFTKDYIFLKSTYHNKLDILDNKNFKNKNFLNKIQISGLKYIKIYDDIVYLLYYNNKNIVRFNINGKKLSPLKSHTKDIIYLYRNYKKELYSIAEDKTIIRWKEEKLIIKRPNIVYDIIFKNEFFYTIESNDIIYKWDENHNIIKEFNNIYFDDIVFFKNIFISLAEIDLLKIGKDLDNYKQYNIETDYNSILYIDKYGRLVVTDNKKFIIY